MRVIIAGPRDLDVSNERVAHALVINNLTPTMIITGGASGVDSCAYRFARHNGIQPVTLDALWGYYKAKGRAKSAGPIRNSNMAIIGEALLVICRKNESTKGTNSMIKEATIAELPVYIHEVLA